MRADETALATHVLLACRARGLKVATAESCTGGLVVAALTDIAGSSEVVERGFVTYSNAAKEAMLGVPADTLARHGAVSRETAEAMARGMRRAAGSDLALAITGIAGPDGGSAEKPVGTVFFGLADGDGCGTKQRLFRGNREEIRTLSAYTALKWLRQHLRRTEKRTT